MLHPFNGEKPIAKFMLPNLNNKIICKELLKADDHAVAPWTT
jgi:hypothetical protein